jgi:hypothetical protein
VMKVYVPAKVSGENYSLSIELVERGRLKNYEYAILGTPWAVLASTQAWGAGTTADWFAGSLLASSSYTSLSVTM